MDKSLSGLNVIVIEDEPAVALGLSKVCRNAFASDVLTTGSLLEANQILRGRHFDVAIVDVRLGDGEAWPLMDELIALGIPMVVHSGHLDAAKKADLPEAVYLSKPATAKEINKALLTAYASRTPKALGLGRSDMTLH